MIILRYCKKKHAYCEFIGSAREEFGNWHKYQLVVFKKYILHFV